MGRNRHHIGGDPSTGPVVPQPAKRGPAGHAWPRVPPPPPRFLSSRQPARRVESQHFMASTAVVDVVTRGSLQRSACRRLHRGHFELPAAVAGCAVKHDIRSMRVAGHSSPRTTPPGHATHTSSFHRRLLAPCRIGPILPAVPHRCRVHWHHPCWPRPRHPVRMRPAAILSCQATAAPLPSPQHRR